jgi:glycosyltransferase involved in cell wall biosynthesis
MDIEHISFSTSGGAGLVARTLTDAQRKLGQNAILSVLTDSDLRSNPLGRPLQTLATAFDNYVVGNMSAQTIGTFKRRDLDGLNRDSFNSDSTIHLHWAQGVISREKIGGLVTAGQPVVWTMHDMAPFTAFCHHSFNCDQYYDNCGACPQAHKVFQKTVSVQFLANRSAFSIPRENFCVVAPTEWMADKARKSAAFRAQRVEVVPNPIAEIFFQSQNRVKARGSLGISPEHFVGISIASDLANKNKSIQNVVAGFFGGLSRSGKNGKLLLVGANGDYFAKNNPDIIDLGSLTQESLAEFAIGADVNISMSLAESSGLTIQEMGALGVPSVVLSGSGMNFLIDDGRNGVLVEGVESLSTAVSDLASNENLRTALGSRAKISAGEMASPAIAAKRYLEIYQSLEIPQSN